MLKRTVMNIIGTARAERIVVSLVNPALSVATEG